MTSFSFWLKKPQPSLKHERLQTIDLIRGVDIVLMVLFNYSVTLSYFGLIRTPSNFFYRSILPISIASVFIFLSGVATYISYERNKETFRKRYFTRGLRLLFFALLITLFSYVFVPEGTIFFGILHFFAVSSFLIPIFIKYNKLYLVALAIIVLGAYLQRMEFGFSYLLWLGFMPENFSTFDYFPLIPWFGVILLGISSGKYIVEKTVNIKHKGKLSSIFIFMGKNSLMIYLIHQPVLIFLLIILGFRIF